MIEVKKWEEVGKIVCMIRKEEENRLWIKNVSRLRNRSIIIIINKNDNNIVNNLTK